MFVAKTRPVIVPQYEHALFSGQLAANYGNADFQRPALKLHDFVEGVTLHDWHYGRLDTHPIGEGNQETWLNIQRRGVHMQLQNLVADIVVKKHIARLISWNRTPSAEELGTQLNRQLKTQIEKSDYEEDAFDFADHITAICDLISFHFAFQADKDFHCPVRPNRQSTATEPLQFRLSEGKRITVTPWPFGDPAGPGHTSSPLNGVVVGFQADVYPRNLVPVALPYEVVPG